MKDASLPSPLMCRRMVDISSEGSTHENYMWPTSGETAVTMDLILFLLLWVAVAFGAGKVSAFGRWLT